MTFDEVLVQVLELLQSEKRVSYRGLKRRFALDDDYLEDLKEELRFSHPEIVDEDGRGLGWVGEGIKGETDKGITGNTEGDKGQWGKGEESLESRVQSRGPKGKEQAVTLQPLDAAAERRQLTVMFCDLVGSTMLSAQLDPEEYREVVRAYQDTCTTVIRRYDGQIAQHLGDGLLVYFGYPTAHEDDAARAVHVGLEIIQALKEQMPENERSGSSDPLRVRIGIHTGVVVIGEIGSSAKREMLALGETPNLAARIQGQAEPDTVFISAATYRLVEGLFACEDRGQPELKGVSTSLTLYRVLKVEEAQSRFQVVARKGLTPLVGRDHEFGLLCERWERVRDGTGQVVLLSGEPGIGKSRLVEALKGTVEHEGARCLELRCSPYHQNSALYPVIEHMQRVLKFHGGDSSEEKLQKLFVGVHSSCAPLQPEAIPLLAALLSLPHPDGYATLTLSPQKQKEKTHEAIIAWLCEEAKQQVVTYAWEDLHWADPSTLELLTLFLNQVPTTRLLAVLTFRPEFMPPWGSHSYLSQLTLSRLAPSHVEVMVDKVTGGKALPPEIVRQIASKTDGVPLFVEELTKMVVELGLVREVNGHYELTGPLPPLAIPSTLQDSLMARLDRLATVREIAQIGATIGREFSYELLKAVAPLTEDALQQGLRQLVDTELVFQSGMPPQARYFFKHALIQDTAYQSLLKSTRQQYHRQIAQVLEERFPEIRDTQPELLAHHYTEASLIEQAIPYWQQAGQKASQRSAQAEAISHLTTALELLKTLPDTPERAQQELTLQIALGVPLMATKGYGAPEVGAVYRRARELCQHVGETPQLFPVLWGLWGFYVVRTEFQTAQELGEQCLRLARNAQDPALLLEAHCALGLTLAHLGEGMRAREHFEQVVTLYDPHQHRSLAVLYGGYDSEVLARANAAALCLWFLGYPDQALKQSHAAITLAQGLAHPFSLVWALLLSAFLHVHRRERPLAQERAEAAIRLASEQGFVHELALGTNMRGWALAQQGQAEEGIAQMHRSLAARQTTGAKATLPSFLALLAEACGKAEQAEEGLAVVAEALEVVYKTGERLNEAELYRLQGELTLQQEFNVQSLKSKVTDPRPLTLDPQGEAEACFLKAIDIARQQQAKSWELRTATSLARLWQQQGKRTEAHTLLSEVYNWFTEGFDTKDLQEAKALLEELS